MDNSNTSIIILILGGMILFNDVEGEYLFTGRLANQENSIDVDVIVMWNKNGDLLTYNTNIYYSSEEIVGASLYYLRNNEKQVILGNQLSSYDYSKRGANKREYGYDYIDNLLKRKDDLYFDLCRDSGCNDVFATIKLNFSVLH